MQQSSQYSDWDVESLGAWLSITIHCAVRYPLYDKPIYHCDCGKLFPAWKVRAWRMANSTDDAIREHRDGSVLIPKNGDI